ncbi:hypothetical protein LCGC14_0983500 [marine sediment metagenome]|uniref:4Fe-4S ferredoxin-type domain-containing protein n=1 Tax=marine sediment metagenome TaxID=412755 RepID=A0A0F9NCH4_9ZZZZ
MYPRVKRIRTPKIDETIVSFYLENQAIEFDRENCIGCGVCYKICPKTAISDPKANNVIDTSFSFDDLDNVVISSDNCCFCGLCISQCSIIGIENDKPKLLEDCSECSKCTRYCARTYIPERELERAIFNGKTRKNSLFGYFQKAITAQTTNKNALEVAQNGGACSTILIHALETGLIDGALLTGMDENWKPKPIIATTKEEILSAGGSRYTMAPSLLVYSDAVYKHKLEKLAFVGMPCQIDAVRKLQLESPFSEQLGKIKLTIGLYCSSNYTYDLMQKLVVEKLEVPINEVKKIDISKGKLFVYKKDGDIKKIGVKQTTPFYWDSCKYCKDYTAEFADISLGSVGAPSDDWNSVFIRSDLGMEIFDDLVAAGKITTADDFDTGRLERECTRKKKNVKIIEKKYLSVQDLKAYFVTTEDLVPEIPDPLACSYCGTCVYMCPFDSITMKNNGEVLDLKNIEIISKKVVPSLNIKLNDCEIIKRKAKVYVEGKMDLDWDKCINCLSCIEVCPTGAFFNADIPNEGPALEYNGVKYEQGRWREVDYDDDKCIRCGACTMACPKDVMTLTIDKVNFSGEYQDIFWLEVIRRLKA